jgi:hypothetical protein
MLSATDSSAPIAYLSASASASASATRTRTRLRLLHDVDFFTTLMTSRRPLHQRAKACDFINIMTYDLHVSGENQVHGRALSYSTSLGCTLPLDGPPTNLLTRLGPRRSGENQTDHCSALYAKGDGYSVDNAITAWLKDGNCKPAQLNMGVPFYAHQVTQPLRHPVTHSPTHPVTHSPSHPVTHSPTLPLTHSLGHSVPPVRLRPSGRQRVRAGPAPEPRRPVGVHVRERRQQLCADVQGG